MISINYTTYKQFIIIIISMSKPWADLCSGTFLHKDTANCDTFAKIGTNEGHTMRIFIHHKMVAMKNEKLEKSKKTYYMLIYPRPGGILGVTAFCLNLDKIQNGSRQKLRMQFRLFYCIAMHQIIIYKTFILFLQLGFGPALAELMFFCLTFCLFLLFLFFSLFCY